jgi:putative transposase
MARPGRNASPEDILRPARTFFVTTKTSMGRRLFQTERNTGLLIDVLRSLVAEKVFEVHDFVIMPDHVHLLLTVLEGMTIERAMQRIKGSFSFRAAREVGYAGEVWQRGFSEVQILGRESFEAHRVYIAENPVKAGLVNSPDDYPFCYRSLAKLKAANKTAEKAIAETALLQGLKPTST